METPKVETPTTETPKVETPKTDTTKTDTPKTETPKVETPKTETPPVVPTKIELKLSEGSLLTQDDLTRIAAQAAKQGLTQEEATKLLSNEEALVKRGAEAHEKQQMDLLAAEHKRWIEAGKADPEIGGDKYLESAELAKRVVDKFGTKELKEGLEKSGLGNYHEFVKLMSRIGRAMDSDKLVIGDTTNKEPASDIISRMYPSEKKKE